MDDLRNERAQKFLQGLNENEFVEKRFTGATLSNAFAKIMAGKASGGDNVQGEFLQRLGDRERETLLEIFNDRLSGGPKPAAWESPTANTFANMFRRLIGERLSTHYYFFGAGQSL